MEIEELRKNVRKSDYNSIQKKLLINIYMYLNADISKSK